MKTVNEKRGYKYSRGFGGKKWIRGRIMYSEGKKYTGNGPESIPCIVKTNLDTYEMEVASLEEHKRFLLPEYYDEYVKNVFVRLAEL